MAPACQSPFGAGTQAGRDTQATNMTWKEKNPKARGASGLRPYLDFGVQLAFQLVLLSWFEASIQVSHRKKKGRFTPGNRTMTLNFKLQTHARQSPRDTGISRDSIKNKTVWKQNEGRNPFPIHPVCGKLKKAYKRNIGYQHGNPDRE